MAASEGTRLSYTEVMVTLGGLKSWFARAAIAAVAWAWPAIPGFAADAAPAAAPAAREPLRSIAEILALSPAEVEALVRDRRVVAESHHCPHGRPTSLTLTRRDLDRQFRRT